MTTLVCFSGQIGSGKSSVSTAVAEALGCARSGFGEFLRAEIERRGGDATCREALQDLGQKLVETDADDFCRAVLAAGGFTSGEDFIVDGVRHVDILQRLTRIATPSRTRLLFLSADELKRIERVSGRSDKEDFSRAATHRVELELRNNLPAIADAVIDATRPFEEVVANCLVRIKQWRGDEGAGGPRR